MAELVAGALRQQIVDGLLQDGERLPKQEDLAERFDISGPSVREGLRILEAEGLITVRRGKFGGAFVHTPHPANAAYNLALVLETKRVPLHEIGSALRDLEPLCAGRCAARPDRATAVVPRLRQLQDQMDACGPDEARDAIRLGLQFHESLILCSASETLITVIGALESIWFAHAEAWMTADPASHNLPASNYAVTRLDEHEEMIAAIADGDVDRATAVARRHIEHSKLHTASDYVAGQQVRASLLMGRRPDEQPA
jgi:DNA-binding FadR family transcriptional regulator